MVYRRSAAVREDPGLIATYQRRTLVARPDGLLCLAEPGTVQPQVGNPHSGHGPLLSEQFLGAFG